MSRRLVLFTNNHPFTQGGGEVMFVAPELPALAARFGNVCVVPLHDGGQQLELPAGVVLDRSLARWWRRWRWAAYLWAPAWPGFAGELSLALRRGGAVGMLRVWRWAAVAQASWRWLRLDADRLPGRVLYSYWRGGQTLAAARWAAAAGQSALTRVHGYELYAERFSPAFQPWVSVYGQLDRVLAVSQHGVRYLVASGVDASRIRLGRLGVRRSARGRASTDGALRIVSCSALSSLKRVESLAEALCLLAQRHPARLLQWTHFGDGPQRHAVEARVAAAPSNLHCTLAGQVANHVVTAHFVQQPTDLFVLLSRSEGLPVSIQEALAAGIPVVATDVGGVGEAVDAAGDNGVLLPADASPEAIVAALAQVLLETDPERLAARRDAAWRRWSCDFDADRNHAATAAELASLVDD